MTSPRRATVRKPATSGLRSPQFCAHAVTGAALATRPVGVRVVSGELVPSVAPARSDAHGGRGHPTKSVFALRHSLKMRGVDAGTVSAQMVNGEAGCNGPNERLVGESVGLDRSVFACIEVSVAPRIHRSGPDPARTSVANDQFVSETVDHRPGSVCHGFASGSPRGSDGPARGERGSAAGNYSRGGPVSGILP